MKTQGSLALAPDAPALTIRQSTLRILEESCPAMAYALAVEHREGPSTGGALRGTVIHDIFARYVTHLWETKRQTDWEACAWIAMQVCAEHPQLTFAQRHEVAEQSRRIGEGFLFEPAHYYGSEEALATDLELADGRVVHITGRLDLLEACLAEGWARIVDCKTNHQIPADSAVRSDFQLMTYAMLVLDNLPPAIDRVYGQLWLTRYNIRCPQKAEAVWTREDIEQFKEHLRVRLAAFLDGKLQHDFVPGTHCQYCPRRRVNDCTLWRTYYGTMPPPPLTERQALKLARQVVTLEQAREERLALLKPYINEHGPLRLGSGAKAETFANWQEEQTSYPFSTLEEAVGLLVDQGTISPPSFDELVSVSKTSRTFRELMKIPDFRCVMADGLVTKQVTRFKHKHEGGGDE